jgi:hypothetical protein
MIHTARLLAPLAATILVTTLGGARPATASADAAWRIRPMRVLPQARDDLQGGAQVRIEGVMSFSGSLAEGWLPPKCGAIDFFCRTGSGNTPFWCTGQRGECEALCKMAWRDIEQAAARGECVAFPLRIWRPADQIVKAIESPFHDPNPFDPVMGVAIVPCQPESASDRRPDLTLPCAASAAVDAGPGPPLDGSVHGSPTGGASGAGGGGSATGGAGGAGDPAQTPGVPSCAISGGGDKRRGASLILLAAALLVMLPAGLRRQGRRRSGESARPGR